jgi:signal transduction histidine kinase
MLPVAGGFREVRLAQLLATRREVLIERWSARVLADPAVPEANRLSTPALRNHIPGFVDRLIEALLRPGPREGGESAGRVLGSGWGAVAHARGRFGQNYSLAAALRELSHFRAVFIEFCWSEHVTVDARDAQLVHAMIDETMATVAVEIDRASRAEVEREVEFRERCVGIVSHDLRNPLQAITVGAELLRVQEGLPENARRAGERIARSAARMGRMISDLLDFAHGRLGGGIPISPQPTDLGTVCRHVVDEFELSHPGRKVVVSANADLSGFWDGDRLAQVITNLVNNALTHGAEAAPVNIRLRDGVGALCVEVHNDGPPIPSELLPRIFDPFRRAATPETPERGGGLGLGLFIAERIVAAHGGSIDVESTLSRGTTFTVSLPRVTEQPSGTVNAPK